ncbi:MAG: hypothetical protein ACXWUX_12340 [Allosphingosinicella sp.]
MRQLIIAAGALLMGTSTIALAADVDMTGKTAIDKGEILTSQSLDSSAGDKALTTGTKLATVAHEAKLVTASATDFDKVVAGEPAEGKLQTAAFSNWAEDGGAAKLAMIAAKTDEGQAIGGPVEEGATKTASVTPQPAAGNYPPCAPGPGDDNCIQLYETGVRAQLAGWDQPNGGLADGASTTAVGGPYEPADQLAAAAPADDFAMNGDGAVDPALGETSDSELAAHADYQGVGGPTDAQSGYPPCSPGPGDDRCIQLYERGVTGAGN